MHASRGGEERCHGIYKTIIEGSEQHVWQKNPRKSKLTFVAVVSKRRKETKRRRR